MADAFVPEHELQPLLGDMLAGRRIFCVTQANGGPHLAQADGASIAPAGTRSVEPVKCLFFRPRADVGPLFDGPDTPSATPRALVGATACDLAALRILDYVFLQGDYVAPDYAERRENTLLISTDCREPRDYCFCTFPGGRPYPREGFDLNLSPLRGGYILEPGSDAGRELLREHGAGLADATEAQVEERDSNRAAATLRLEGRAHEMGLYSIEGLAHRVRQSRRDDLWDELAEECVECGACNLVCPTCHCFLLVDLQQREGFRRFRNWDACLYPAFAREASGANPRPRRADRLHGRLEKKFEFIKQNAGAWGCVGCGRCVEACAGGIDVRETLKELVNA